MAEEERSKRVLNVNVGVLGHVDSGKTSLVAALSAQLSTAALDKHPQSKERGITLDLGFSAFTVPLPPHLAHLPYDELQVTLVDCPGHASLIRTIISGAQIIDMALLVVDVTKGMQTQTAECLVVAEVATSRLLVALNKVDLLQPPEERPRAMRRATKRLGQTFALTKFAGASMLPVAAKPGSPPDAAPLGVEQLRAALVALVAPTPRPWDGPLLLAVDHCFPMRGVGTVMTGTVLQVRPVKSIQVFRRPVSRAQAGERVGVCVTQLDAGLMERGLACAPGTVPSFRGAIAAVEKIRFYAGRVPSRSKFHVTVGHSTLMAHLTFFGTPDGNGLPPAAALAAMMGNLAAMTTPAAVGEPTHGSAGAGAAGTVLGLMFDFDRDYICQEELYGLEGRPLADAADAVAAGGGGAAVTAGQSGGAQASDLDTVERPDTEGEQERPGRHFGPQWVLLRFDQAVTAPRNALVIGSKFDAGVHGEACRLAFYGRLVALLDPTCPDRLARLRVFKAKMRAGVLERLQPDGCGGIVSQLIKKESDVAAFVGLKVTTGRGEEGIIEGSFGKSGKLKVHFPGGLAPEGRSTADNVVILRCKRYLFDPGADYVARQ
ncbi:hypothetical protein Agub_g4205 [Astrephomene gubernaculifera]|uniref:Tr-type G domain-containing protein n=1 Tax=Astrephomene gubernaculifera TaxID=47775 RepID=A0AAD3HJN7_9CHLO|nr:hypothetical protein Agub_g4205 [Astrephomene gubernaculifera]